MSTAYRLLLIGHIISVVIAFGSLLGLPVMGRLVRDGAAATDAISLSWARSVIRYRRLVAEPAFISVGLFGIALVIGHPISGLWTARWVQLALLFYVISAIAILAVQGPILRRMPQLIATVLEVSPLPGVAREYTANAKRLAREARVADAISGVSAVGLCVMVAIMIFKPT
jgi:hypothetical protein